MIKIFKLYDEIEQAGEYFLETLKPFVFTASDGTKLPYRLYVPPYYDENKKYPLQIHLHGGGLRGDDNAMQLRGDTKQTQMMMAHQLQEEFIFAVPQCPVNEFWSGYMAKNWPWDPDHVTPIEQVPESNITRAVYELTMELANTYSVDKSRMYVSGASLGGSGSYELLYRHPDVFAAALIGCTMNDPSIAPVLAKTPIYLIHGTKDVDMPVWHSHIMVEELRKYHDDFVYLELPNKVHDFTRDDDGDAILARGMRWIYTKRK